MTAQIVESHRVIVVIRDYLFPGGTKARHIGRVFEHADEAVYASPAEGGAKTALATVAGALGKRATIFVAKRAKPHARTLEAARLGAKDVPLPPGYLSVVQARAKDYCRNTGAHLVPFGAEIPARWKRSPRRRERPGSIPKRYGALPDQACWPAGSPPPGRTPGAMSCRSAAISPRARLPARSCITIRWRSGRWRRPPRPSPAIRTMTRRPGRSALPDIGAGGSCSGTWRRSLAREGYP